MTPQPPSAHSARPSSTVVSSGSSNRPNKRSSPPSDGESDADNTRDASRSVNGKGSGITVETPHKKRKRKRRKTNGKDKAKEHLLPVAGPSTERVHEPKTSIKPSQHIISSLHIPEKESFHEVAHSDSTMSSEGAQPPIITPGSPPTVKQDVVDVNSHASSCQTSSTVPPALLTQPQPVDQPGVQSQASISSLQTELSEKTETVQAHATLLKSILTTVTCQICLDPMYKPYTLAPCGHTSCYSCLVSWFRAPPADGGPGLAPHLDPQDYSLLALSSSMLMRKKKTCPHCRSVVQVAPIESWSLKSIIGSLRASGLLQDVIRAPEDRGTAESSGSGTPEGGPWHGIFRKINDQPSEGRWGDLAWLLDEGDYDDVSLDLGEDQPDHAPFGDSGIVDEEDGVRRCSQCLHEIWDTVCSSCGLIYPDLAGDEGEDDQSDSAEFEEDSDHFYPQGFVFDHIRRMAARYRPGGGSDDDVADGGDDESYEGSFIDDGDAQPEAIAQEEGPSDRDVHNLLDDDDDNSEVLTPLRPSSRSTRRLRLAPTSSEDEEDDEIASHTRSITRDSESSDNDSASHSSDASSDENPVVRRPPARSRRIIDSGDDDSDPNYDSDRSLTPL